MIVFPMAGLSSRFTAAGYQQPKYMLSLWGATVFEYAVRSFQQDFSRERFVFIYRDVADTRRFIEQKTQDLGIRSASFVCLDRETDGQAETVELGLSSAGAGDGEPITIFNIDTFRNPQAVVTHAPAVVEGTLEVFRGSGANWSFVEPDSDAPGIARRTAEKIQISDLCCSGLYSFSSHSSFKQALQSERQRPQSAELYVAPIYNHLIEAGHQVGWSEIATDDLRFCGTPAEYEHLLSQPRPWTGLD